MEMFFICGCLPWNPFFLGWNYEVAHPDANRKMHYVIEKSNKILGEEKEKTGGVHTAYTHPEHSKWNIEGEVKEKGKGQGNPGQGNQSFFWLWQ